MKNQYFGDINDYRKYGLLRLLTGDQIRGAMCWMMTPDDGRSDGSRIKYLSESDEWRRLDPELFDHLQNSVLHHYLREISEIENSHMLPSCVFLSDLVPDDPDGRALYFDRLGDLAQSCHLIFFDPDNGIEVTSAKLGRKGSSKYLYWQEIRRFWSAGHSLLIYQHFPRVPRAPFIDGEARELMEKTGAREVISFETSHVVFFLLPQPDRSEFFGERCALVSERWGSQFRVACQGQGQVTEAC